MTNARAARRLAALALIGAIAHARPALAQETVSTPATSTSASPAMAAAVAPSAEPAPPTSRTPNTLAWVSLISGGVSLGAGIGFGVGSVIEHRRARDLGERAEDGELTAAEQASYDAAIATRDDLRVVSGITAGTGLGLFLLAGILFARDDAAREAPAPAQVAPTTARPWVGPGLAGGSATWAF